MLPRVILHNTVSLDGRIDGFPIDLCQYYELAATWKEDATLAGSDTFLSAAKEAPPEEETVEVLYMRPSRDVSIHNILAVIQQKTFRPKTLRCMIT